MTPGPISINSATFVGTRLAGIPGAVLCTLGCIIPSFIICLTLAHFYYKYRNFSGVQTVLSALRPAVVALIASAGLSILLLGLFMSDLSGITLANFRPIETCLFIGGFFCENTASTLSPSSLVPVWWAPLLIPCSVWSLKNPLSKKLSSFRRAFLFYLT